MSGGGDRCRPGSAACRRLACICLIHPTPPLPAPRSTDKGSVGEEDVRAWSAAQRSSKPAAARPGNLFNRMSLDE